jgi:hypothetical protein
MDRHEIKKIKERQRSAAFWAMMAARKMNEGKNDLAIGCQLYAADYAYEARARMGLED